MKTKEEIVKSFNELYGNSEYVFVVDCKGVNAEDTSRFRSDLNTKCGVKFFVCKNTLNKIATNGTKFNGQCGVIFCNENEKVVKVISDFCFKEKKLTFKDCLHGSEHVSAQEIEELASLPSLEVLRARILCVLNSVGSSLARAVAERVKKEGGEIE